jgi:hypothetical protein
MSEMEKRCWKGGKYENLRRLGKNNYGDVYLIKDTVLNIE